MPCRPQWQWSSRLFLFAQSSYTPFNKVELRANSPDSHNILLFDFLVNALIKKNINFLSLKKNGLSVNVTPKPPLAHTASSGNTTSFGNPGCLVISRNSCT